MSPRSEINSKEVYEGNGGFEALAINPSSSTTVGPSPRPSKPYLPHLGPSRQYWRDIILGVNDGLVSTFLLVAVVAGSGMPSVDILMTAIAGAIAGAVSMCAGEYVATKSQNEVMNGELELEKVHIKDNLDEELHELDTVLLELIGIPSEEVELKAALVEFYERNPDALLSCMAVLELGVLEQEQRSPLMAGLTSCLLFFLGALPSVLPFLWADEDPVKHGLIPAAVLTTVALMFVGAVKTWASRGNFATAALENLVISGVGGGFAYGVGLIFDKLLH